MTMDFKKIAEWLEQYEQLNSWLYFNSTPFIDGSTAVNSVPGDRVLRAFIDGTKEAELVFAIDMIKAYDTGTSEVNYDAMDEVSAFEDWIELQAGSNYPDFTGVDIQKIEVLNNIPSFAVNENQTLAKYQFQVKITYRR